ncbi:class I SAM-dependent methyltransferase [Bdellovibrio bacteriovorus]|uniref:class I SAM-dependent methyltransferase n=1 Tax=Bdellovibrio bacteriovorus TaxID=959 RepID=UPI0035A6A0DA
MKSKEIQYSDGDIESDIIHAIRTAGDVRAGVDIAEERHALWPFEYHLSESRANLLRHVCFSGKKVLEVGGGMGAISRQIAESCDHLQIVEGTARRVSGIEARLRDLSNYSIFCGNFSDFNATEKYDVVVVIGVLEYADVYIEAAGGQSAYETFLAKARSLLTDQGVLILAIENRLGMKYFSGAGEDHTGKVFDGISGYKTGKSVRTFAKKELCSLLDQVGFSSWVFQYPYPDYKLPNTIVAESLEEVHPQLFANLISQGNSRDYCGTHHMYFHEGLANSSLEKTGLLGQFANSFLVFASMEQGAIERVLDMSVVAHHYSKGRRNPTRTSFFLSPEKNVFVAKQLLRDVSVEVDYGEIIWRGSKQEKVVEGVSLFNLIRRMIAFREFPELENEMRRYLAWAGDTFGKSGKLGGEAWDCIPQNILIANGEYVFFDREWFLKELFDPQYLLIRFCLTLDEYFVDILRSEYRTLLEFCAKIMGHAIASEDLRRMLEMEHGLQVKLAKLDNRFLSAQDRLNFFESSTQLCERMS